MKKFFVFALTITALISITQKAFAYYTVEQFNTNKAWEEMIPKDELWKILKPMKECIKIITISKITRTEIITTIQAIQGKDLYIDLEVQADCRV